MVIMKKIKYLFAGILLIIGFGGCMDDFIEKPSVTGLTVEEVFSSAKNVEGAIALAYSYNLSSGLPIYSWTPPYLPYEATEAIMGGEDVDSSWGYMKDNLVSSGMSAADNYNEGAGLSDDYFPYNYKYIRHAFLVIENIYKVPDMSDEEKEIVVGEMKGLIAFRYLEMLKRYGGVPLVKKTLTMVETAERASVQETLNYILELCNESAAGLNNARWSADWTGRLTKGVALAIKAEALMYAARPLFNAEIPYLPYGADNDKICLGNYKEERWQEAIDANLAVLEWGAQNGYELIDTDQPFEDYGTAVGVPCNKEVLLAYKHQGVGQGPSGLYKNYCPNPLYIRTGGGTALCEYRGMSYEMLLNFKKANGGEQTWAGVEERPYQEYYDKVQEMEPRFKASAFAYGINPWNNEGNNNWSITNPASWLKANKNKQGCARNIKFWYNTGTREWFEFPIYRMAEFYLNLAEAYNELQQPGSALTYLNIIRDRAGLPDETVTDYGLLKKSIQREWTVEFYNENQYYAHARHWKLGNEMVAGIKHIFTFKFAGTLTDARTPEDFVSYRLDEAAKTYVWLQKMYLSPITLSEVNKGYIRQNPGY